MITRVPEEIEERLEAHEADLNALEISDQAATAFVARSKPTRPPQNKPYANTQQNIRTNNPPVANAARAPFKIPEPGCGFLAATQMIVKPLMRSSSQGAINNA
jgi:hypothetical protein